MWTFIFYGLFLIGLILMVTAIIRNKARTYWLAGLIMYVVSFLGSWSIWFYLLVVPFILWSVALAHSFGLVKKPWQNAVFTVIGMVLWYVNITTIDEYWLFLPFAWLV